MANFALGLPDNLRITTKCNKVVLRAIGRRYLDPRILSMRKRGFGIPIAQWFRNALSGRIAELAAQYATRIVNLKDGVIRSDSMPYTPEAAAPAVHSAGRWHRQ